MSLGPLYVLLGEVSIQVFAHFLIELFVFLVLPCMSSLLIMEIKTLVWCIIGKCVLPYGQFPFHFDYVFFSSAEAYYFDEIPFVYSFLYIPCSRGHWWTYFWVEYLRISCLCSPLGLLWCQDLYLSLLSILSLFFVWCKLVKFPFLHIAVQLSQHHLWKRLFLLHFMLLPPLLNINWQ